MSDTAQTALILLSDKRSGSTMLQNELCRHPAIGHVDYSSHTYFETQHWLKAAAMLDRPSRLYSGAKPYSGYGSAKNARAYMIDTVKGNLPDLAIADNDRDLAFSSWQALCDTFAKPIFFEKSPQYPANWAALSLLMEWAKQTSIQVKFLFMFRNPQAVQYSAQKLFKTPPGMRQFGWLEAQRNLLACQAMIPQSQQMSFRYEEVTAAPKEMFGRICDFVGVPREPTLGESVSSSSLSKWKLDPQFTLKLDPAVEQMAIALGYSEEELDNPHGVLGELGDNRSMSARMQRLKNRTYDNVLRPIKLRLSQ